MIRHFKLKSLSACVVMPYTLTVIGIDIYVRLLSLAWAKLNQRKNCTVTVYSILQQVCCMENTVQ